MHGLAVAVSAAIFKCLIGRTSLLFARERVEAELPAAGVASSIIAVLVNS
jgi:hypothetical protein